MSVSDWILSILKGLSVGFGFGMTVWLIRTTRRLLRGVLNLE